MSTPFDSSVDTVDCKRFAELREITNKKNVDQRRFGPFANEYITSFTRIARRFSRLPFILRRAVEFRFIV